MDSLLIALLDKSGSMTDGPNTPEFLAWRKNINTSSPTYRDEQRHWGRGAVYSVKAKASMDAFNHFLQVMKYRRDACDCLMAQFAGNAHNMSASLDITVTHRFVNLFEAQPLNPETYNVGGGGTAIYDAILWMIKAAEDKIAALPAEQRPTQVTMLIQTDGDDTNSRTGSYQAVEKMLELRKQRWNFVFVATGGAGAGTGRRLGFTMGKDMVEYDDSGAGGLEAFSKAAEAVLESLITGNMGV